MNEYALVADGTEFLSASIQARLVEFVRLARANGFRAGVTESIDAQRIARCCGVSDSQRLHWGLRSLLCSGQDDWDRFPELFDAYWRPGNLQTCCQPINRLALTVRAVPKVRAQTRTSCNRARTTMPAAAVPARVRVIGQP